MIGEDVFYLTVAELGERIRARRLSPVELTQGYLDRIKRYAPKLNAFATVTEDVAMEQARAAEREIGKGRYRGPLHGIPYGAKDLLATAGIRTTWGARPTRDQIPDKDATVIRMLRDAGAVLLGKLSMVEFAGCLGYRYADSSLQGPMRNPWDPERWTGGSSSGTGASVAAGLVAFGIGTETWGSILCPSAFCGVTGLRPTYGRVSRAGGMVGAYTFDKIGPLARSAEDCLLILEGISGHDPDDATSSTVPVSRLHSGHAGGLPPGFRGAIVPLDFAKTKGAEPEVKAAFDAAVGELRAAGLHMEEAKLPEFPASEVAGLLITAEALSTFEKFYNDGTVWELRDPYAPYQREIAAGMRGDDVVKAWRMRSVLQDKMVEFFERYDGIVTPNFMSVAPPIEGDLNQYLPYPDPVGGIGNACGLPSIALPCGFGKGHMPISFQVMGPPHQEGDLVRIGKAYQSRTRFHRERPPQFA